MFCGLQKFDSVITKIRKNICKSKNIFRCNLCHRETVSLHNSRFQMFVGLCGNILRVQIYIRCSSVSRRLPALSKIKTNLNFKPKLPKFHAKYVPKTDTCTPRLINYPVLFLCVLQILLPPFGSRWSTYLLAT